MYDMPYDTMIIVFCSASRILAIAFLVLFILGGLRIGNPFEIWVKSGCKMILEL